MKPEHDPIKKLHKHPNFYYGTDLGVLLKGDCLEILPHLEPVDLVLTDPPYNCGKDYGVYKDNLPRFEFLKLIEKATAVGNNYGVYTDSHRLKTFWDILPESSPIFIHVAANGFSNNNNIRQDHHAILTNAVAHKQISSFLTGIRVLREGYFFREEKTGHPCQTALSVMTTFLDYFSTTKQTVLDPFLGSGTTAVACERLNRKWIGVEMEEKYCEMAAKRIENERKQRKLF